MVCFTHEIDRNPFSNVTLYLVTCNHCSVGSVKSFRIQRSVGDGDYLN